MNDEIKATLEWLKECGNNDYIFETGNSKMLLDYITNLQKQLEAYENMRKELKEYVKEHSEMTNLQIYGIDNVLSFRGSVDDLLNILNKVSGSDE